MTDEEFARFQTLCPLHTRVKGAVDMVMVRDHGNFNPFHCEGVVVRHGFEFTRSAKSKQGKGTSWIDVPVVLFFDDPHEWDVQPKNLMYSIDGEWITFAALMEGQS